MAHDTAAVAARIPNSDAAALRRLADEQGTTVSKVAGSLLMEAVRDRRR